MTHNNICTMGIPEEDSEQGIKNLFEERVTKHCPSLVKEKDTQVQEAQSRKQVGPKEAYTTVHHN